MTSKYIAGLNTDDCLKSVFHDGEPAGKWVKIAGLDTYVSAPKNYAGSGPAQRVMLFFADIWGPTYNNNQLLMDYFASNGYLVVSPDYFEGDPVGVAQKREGFDKDAWIAGKYDRADIIVPDWVEAIRAEYGDSSTRFVAVGYCFGAPATFRYTSTDWLVAGAVAHPARLRESNFHLLTKPMLFSCAEMDHTFPLESRREAEDILIAKKHAYHFQVFSSVSHGFAVRGDPKNPPERWAKEESARSILRWFDHHIQETA